jgi:putative methyltransferase (TIGR04325 family)
MAKQAIWSGIYDAFPSAAETVSPAFDGSQWLERQLAVAEQAMEATPASGAEPDNDAYFEGLIAGFLSAKRGPVKVVDFGGSLALAYLQLLKSYRPVERMRWTVVESAPICEAGKDFAKHHRLNHVDFIADIGRTSDFDVFFARNAFHYTRDWHGLISTIAQRGAELVVLRGVIAGPTPTFCTLQNYYGQQIPVWFFNEAELVQSFGEAGFGLVSRRPVKQRYFGKLQSPPMANFPRSHRGKMNIDLVFALN